jgi:hypothetical protein
MTRAGRSQNELEVLLELVLSVAPRRSDVVRIAHEFACSCRYLGVPDAINRWIRNHNHRAALGSPWPAALRGKSLSFRFWLERTWLSEYDRRGA